MIIHAQNLFYTCAYFSIFTIFIIGGIKEKLEWQLEALVFPASDEPWES